MNDKILDIWNEIKVIVESLEVDVNKCHSGNVSAGIRARKGIRLLKTRAHELVKETLASDKNKSNKKRKSSKKES